MNMNKINTFIKILESVVFFLPVSVKFDQMPLAQFVVAFYELIYYTIFSSDFMLRSNNFVIVANLSSVQPTSGLWNALYLVKPELGLHNAILASLPNSYRVLVNFNNGNIFLKTPTTHQLRWVRWQSAIVRWRSHSLANRHLPWPWHVPSTCWICIGLCVPHTGNRIPIPNHQYALSLCNLKNTAYKYLLMST